MGESGDGDRQVDRWRGASHAPIIHGEGKEALTLLAPGDESDDGDGGGDGDDGDAGGDGDDDNAGDAKAGDVPSPADGGHDGRAAHLRHGRAVGQARQAALGQQGHAGVDFGHFPLWSDGTKLSRSFSEFVHGPC